MEESQDIFQLYIRDIGKFPLLSAEEEKTLARLIKTGNSKARERMIVSNLRLVIKIAKKYNGCGLHLSDLVEEGNISLIEMIEKFDPEAGYRFSTYAVLGIRQAMNRAIARHGRTVRVPMNAMDTVVRFLNVRKALTKKLGRTPEHSELATEMNLKPEQINRIMAIIQPSVSLDAERDPDKGYCLKDRLPDTTNPLPNEKLSTKERKKTVESLLHLLAPREREVLKLRFGLNGNGGEPKTQEKTGKPLGLSRNRVNQIEGIALNKLKRYLHHNGITLSDLL